MKHRIIGGLLVASLLFTLTGCATITGGEGEYQGTMAGAGIGAATGAVAGAIFAGEGSRGKGAIIGGLAGALIGGAIGNYTFDQKKGAAETASRYRLPPGASSLVRIEQVTANPATVQPGDQVDVSTTYAVVGSSSLTQQTVTERCEIRIGSELVGNPEVTVNHATGTYTSSLPIILPRDARRGTYTVTMTVRTDSSSDSRQTTFVVR